MSNEQNNIDDLFRGKLRDYSVDTPEHLWGGIVAGRKPLYKALQFLKLNKGGVAIALVLMVAGGIATYTSVAGYKAEQTAYNAPQAANNPTTQATNTATIAQDNAAMGNTTPVSAPNTADINQNLPASSASNPTITANTTGNNGSDVATTVTLQNNPAPTSTEASETNNTSENERAQLEEIETLPHVIAETLVPTVFPTSNVQYRFVSLSLLSPDKAEGKTALAIKPPKMNKWSWDVYTSLDFTGRRLVANGVNANYVSAVENAEKYNPGFSIGARVNYDATQCLKACIPTKIRAGLQFTSLSEKVNFENNINYTTITTKTLYKYNIFGEVIGTETVPDTISGTKTVSSSHRNTYSFVDVPVQLEMQLYRSRRIGLFTTVGGVANLMFVQRGHRIKNDLSGVENMRNQANPYKTNAGFSALAGVGMEYKMCSGFSILAEGTYRHGLSNVMNNGAGMRQNMRTVSASVGMRFRF